MSWMESIANLFGVKPKPPEVRYVVVPAPQLPPKPEPLVQLSPGGRDAAHGPLAFRPREDTIGKIQIGERSPSPSDSPPWRRTGDHPVTGK